MRMLDFTNFVNKISRKSGKRKEEIGKGKEERGKRKDHGAWSIGHGVYASVTLCSLLHAN
jgi:hypothetical protein